MFNNKNKISLIVLLIVSMVMSGCSTLFPTQRSIDDILPNMDYHYYCEADLIPYSKEELTNATILYGQELSEYYFLNVNKYDEQIVEEVDEEGKEEFMARLTYMNSNYKLCKARYEKYAELEGNSKEDAKKIDNEFNEFYKLKESPFGNTVKENNNKKLAGCPEVSLRIDVSTLKNEGIIYDATADVYRHIVLEKNKYSKMKIGDKITIDFPESNSDKENSNLKSVELVLVATDSFIRYLTEDEIAAEEAKAKKNEGNDDSDFLATMSEMFNEGKSKDKIYYVTPNDPLSKYRSLIDADGNVIEVYNGTETVKIMKDARFAQGIDETRLVTQILREDPGVKNFTINDITDAKEGGGYVDEIYKDEIYVNTIYTNLKGYITSGYRYEQMYIDNEYARENNTKYQTAKQEANSTNAFDLNAMNGFDPSGVNGNFDPNAMNGMNGNFDPNAMNGMNGNFDPNAMNGMNGNFDPNMMSGLQ